jgi:hypothetical protein
VHLATISNFAASGSWITLDKDVRDGAGCGGEHGGRSPARSQAHSPPQPRSGAAGTAADLAIGL